MDALIALIQRAQAGDREAFGAIVQCFQDMAVGYAYAILGDFHLAEDAAQEAFLQAFRDLPTLHEPRAFAAWFRRIVFKHCDRLTRRKQKPIISLDAVRDVACADVEPAQAVEQAELQAEVQAAIAGLPELTRAVTLLFYISDYSQQEIATFLEMPVTTVKKRLQSARRQLKERMLAMVQDNLHEQAPSRNENFAQRVTAAVAAVQSGDVAALTTLLQQEPGLATARSSDGRNLLSHLTDWPGHRPSGVEIAQLLINAGADINARTIDSAVGETPLQWAVSANDVAVAEALIDAGAPVDGVNDDRRPLAQALFYGQLAAAELLVRRGATIDLEFAAGLGRVDLLQTFFDAEGHLLPTASWHHPPTNEVVVAPEGAGSELLEQALVYACFCTQVEAAAYLLNRGADVNAQPSGFDVQASPLHWAAGGGNVALVELLLAHGADPSARDPEHGATPYGWAEHHGHTAVCDLLRRHGAAA